ncbi:MAG: hypothetical protein HY356_09120 [Gammaproteobacteria bacterium]|nr:hypothetical protein [Gammaproteobacteria bacterium]
MYQWIDPETGTTQLSGKPPAWYRSAEAGPRVFVFDKGKIIDDTAINIPQEESELLRRQAFVKAEEDKEAAKQKALEAAQLKFALDKNKQEEPSTAEVEGPTETLVEAEKEKVSDVTPNITDLSVEEMRALILDWENQRTQQARELVVPDEAEDIQQ